MKLNKTLKVIIIIAAIAGLIVLIYEFFLKNKVAEISSDELSELTNMDISFESYDFFDESTLEISGLSIKSPYPKSQYKEVNKYHTDWLEFKIQKIKLSGFNYSQLINNKKFFATSIAIDTANIYDYRNKTLPNPPYKYKPLIATMLRQLKTAIKIDTIYLRQVNITYDEKTEHSEDPGQISFNNLYATIYNVTNDSAQLAQNKNLTIDANADLMKKIPIKAHTVFDITSDNDFFTFEANVDSFDATELNPVITGVLPVKIKGGQILPVKLQFDATDDHSDGWVDFQFKDLEFEIFDSDKSEIKSTVATQVAKAALRNSNLKSKDDYEQGEISFNRRKDRFIFNYWWNSLKTGMIDAMLSKTADAIIKKDEKQKHDYKGK